MAYSGRKKYNFLPHLYPQQKKQQPDLRNQRPKWIFLDGFKKLYSSEQVACDKTWEHSHTFDNTLSRSEALNLSLSTSDAKILFGLNSMKAFKAPEPDRIHDEFFQRFWIVVGDSVKFEVKRIFQNRKIPLC